jgi:restriction endonuclease Mrr
VFLTTSRFTKQAVEEARADGKPPIGLVDGSTIAKVMIDSGLAVKTTEVSVYRFEPSVLHQLVSDPGERAP